MLRLKLRIYVTEHWSKNGFYLEHVHSMYILRNTITYTCQSFLHVFSIAKNFLLVVAIHSFECRLCDRFIYALIKNKNLSIFTMNACRQCAIVHFPVPRSINTVTVTVQNGSVYGQYFEISPVSYLSNVDEDYIETDFQTIRIWTT